MTEAKMLWKDQIEYSVSHSLLAKQMYVVVSTPVNGLGPVLDNLDIHVEYQTKLETEGIMFAAGPLASEDLSEWLGEGMFVYRANSFEEAVKLAEADPMHSSGARTFNVRQWLVNEGTYSVQVFYSSGQKPRIL
jgi:uncharacterized protein YciI